MNRVKSKWNVQLSTDNGEIVETVFEAHWSPHKDYVWASIARAAAVEAIGEQRMRLLPVAATFAV